MIYLTQYVILDCTQYIFYVKYTNRLNADFPVIKCIHNSFLANLSLRYIVHFWNCQITNWIHQDTFINLGKNVIVKVRSLQYSFFSNFSD